MTFDEILVQVRELLEREGRVAYRILKRRFELDDEDLEDLKADLIDAKRLAVDEDGKVLVWVGGEAKEESENRRVRESEKRQTASSDSRLQTLDSSKPEAERRQLTVMFCDLVGSTALSEQLDPEELREVVRAYQATCAEIISRFEGHIAQYLGDGLLVYFGYPAAHEDDAQRAVRAGLDIIAEMRKPQARLQRPLPVRIGIHTGLVVVGEMGGGGKHEQLALGDTPNIAARLQGLAAPNTMVISAATQRLVAGLFECQEIEPQPLKGISTPLSVYQVVQESEAQSRFEVAVSAGLTPLIGREHEVGLLEERWEKAKQGAGQVVLLSGEAGIGKSRLVQVLKEQVATEPHARLECHCSPYYRNSAFYSVIEHLQRLLRFSRDDSPQQKFSKLEGALEHYGFALPEVTPLFAALLSLPLPERYPPLLLTPQRQKQKTLEALVFWLLTEAERQPVLLVWEDLQWVDPSTLEFINFLIDQGPTACILTLLTFRPDFIPPWTMHSHVTQIMLSRLSHKQVEVVIEKLIGGKSLPVDVLQQLMIKTDGVPLFVEELTKTVLESGLLRERESRYELTGPLPPLAIPATLHDSLTARLDRLATVKEVAQLGATLGREFSYELLQAVSPLDETILQRELGRLVEAELLFQRGLLPQARYIFKHALIQDAAYQSLLKSTRQQYHQQIAQVLEARFPEITETQPELLAHHYTEAGLCTQAIPYCQHAGQRAAQRSAHVEAISHLTKGLELLEALPDTPEHTQHELTLQIALGLSLQATKGYAAAEVRNAFARARELCRQVGETPQLFPVLSGLLRVYYVRGELQTARELGEQCLHLAQSVQDPALFLAAYYLLGATLFYLGELDPARTHLEQGATLYDPQQHRSLALLYGTDPGVACLCYVSNLLWCLGYPDQALQKSQESLTLAQERAHLVSFAGAWHFAGVVHQFRREGPAAQERAEAAIALSSKQGFQFFLAMGTIDRGWALAEQGQGEEGIVQIRQGLAAYQATGAELWRPYFLALLAEVCGKVGQTEEGLNALAEALAVMDDTGEHQWAAELYRLKGQLKLQKFQVSSSTFQVPSPQAEAEAEACFLKAIEITRHQSAKSLELRAVMSLSRLWQQQGKKEEARKLLAEVYDWFTEGFDTKDLQEAKALLEELRH